MKRSYAQQNVKNVVDLKKWKPDAINVGNVAAVNVGKVSAVNVNSNLTEKVSYKSFNFENYTCLTAHYWKRKNKIGSLVLEDCSERELPLVVLCLDGYHYLSATVSNK